MILNWRGNVDERDGYGRFNPRMVSALRNRGIGVRTHSFDYKQLTIVCLPPFQLYPIPGRCWLFSMTEGSLIPPDWVERIKESGVERVIVPCEHNVKAFRDSGISLPISVVPGGVDPEEFPSAQREIRKPYTFLTFADRGSRKGWEEVWSAFYKAFGGKTDGEQGVRLIIKSRLGSSPILEMMSKAKEADPRIIYRIEDLKNLNELFSQVDCLVLPSRSEGWGMIQREAACTGLPVITQKYSGLDDGFTDKWAIVVEGGEMQPIPNHVDFCLGEWMVADTDILSQVMRFVFRFPEEGIRFGERAALWLRENQTWDHSAERLLRLVNGN